jgi:UDP-N-acetylmuramoyl-tripeptide--D-alanyl-D-alanine ligase
LANLLLTPVEKLIQRYYLGEAGRKIRRIHPMVVGITGSYGKTSTKDFLAHILEDFKPVLATPKSYNTLLGVSRVINGSLKPEHAIFLVEMGAYIPGEIERICKLVHPDIGTITAIGPQHLERFGSLEYVARAKFELIRALPASGVAVFSADDAFTERFRDQAAAGRSWQTSQEPPAPS